MNSVRQIVEVESAKAFIGRLVNNSIDLVKALQEKGYKLEHTLTAIWLEKSVGTLPGQSDSIRITRWSEDRSWSVWVGMYRAGEPTSVMARYAVPQAEMLPLVDKLEAIVTASELDYEQRQVKLSELGLD